MGRGLSSVQKKLLLAAEGRCLSFRSACEMIYKECEPRLDEEKEFGEYPVTTLQSLGFGGHPDAKRMLCIRATVSRSLSRLESRGLITRLDGRFTVTLDGKMLAVTEL